MLLLPVGIVVGSSKPYALNHKIANFYSNLLPYIYRRYPAQFKTLLPSKILVDKYIVCMRFFRMWKR